MKVLINLLHHANSAAACIISIIINAPAVETVEGTPKQILLTSLSLLQLPYCVSMLLYVNRCLHNKASCYKFVSIGKLLRKVC